MTSDGAEPTLAETIVAMKAANDAKVFCAACARLVPEIERLQKIIDDYVRYAQKAELELRAARER